MPSHIQSPDSFYNYPNKFEKVYMDVHKRTKERWSYFSYSKACIGMHKRTKERKFLFISSYRARSLLLWECLTLSPLLKNTHLLYHSSCIYRWVENHFYKIYLKNATNSYPFFSPPAFLSHLLWLTVMFYFQLPLPANYCGYYCDVITSPCKTSWIILCS